jgi:tetratricopeptide (TPR) repeat protein
VLRVTGRLIEDSVPPRRIHRALRELRKQLGSERLLSEVRIVASDGRIVVQDRASTWHPESGQLLLDLDLKAFAHAVSPLATSTRAAATNSAVPALQAGATAEDWYEAAIDLEESDLAEARSAYERAIDLDPDHADAHIDLGHLLHEAGDIEGARLHYQQALAVRPDDATASYNLGVALEDLGRKDDAIGAYERAVQLDPELADAYCNLGGLYHEQGRGQDAIRALTAFRRLSRR